MFNCGNTSHIAIDCRKNKKKETTMSRSDIRSRLVNYKPQNPCSHCGSKWLSIFMCNEYHNLYYDNYEPLAKFYRKEISDKADNVSHEHASVNLNSDKANFDSDVTNGVYCKRKASTVNVNKMSG